MSANSEHMSKEVAAKLVGAKIVTSLLDTTDEGGFGFIAVTPEGKEVKVWVSCDAEGNGPGWLHFEE